MKTRDWIILLAVALLWLMKSKAAEPIETDYGTFRMIRPQGEPNEFGAVDIALYSKDGVDSSETVYMQTIHGKFIPIPA